MTQYDRSGWRSEQIHDVRGRKALLDMRKPRCNSRAVRSRYAGDCKALRGMSFDTTARVAPEKQDMPACLPLVSMTGCERAVMNEVQLNWEAAAADGHVLVNAPANRLAVFANTIGDVVLVAGDDESETVTTLDVQEAVRLVAMLRDAIDDAAPEARRVADECAAFLRRNLRVVGALR